MSIRYTRNLLYHRGIDDSIGTYITDYIESAVCAIYAFVLVKELITSYKSGCQFNDKSTIAVIIIQISICMSSLTGGLTHQFLYDVS